MTLPELSTEEALERLLGSSEETLTRMLRQAMEQRHFRLPAWVDDPAIVAPETRDDVIQGLRNMDDPELRWVMPRFWLAVLKEKRRRGGK